MIPVVQADPIIRGDRLADGYGGRWRIDGGRSNLSLRPPLQGQCSPSNRAGRSALGTALFATNAAMISVANSIGSHVATNAAPALDFARTRLTPSCRSVDSRVRRYCRERRNIFRPMPKGQLDRFEERRLRSQEAARQHRRLDDSRPARPRADRPARLQLRARLGGTAHERRRLLIRRPACSKH